MPAGQKTDPLAVRAVEVLRKDFSITEMAKLLRIPARTLHDVVWRIKRKEQDFFDWDAIADLDWKSTGSSLLLAHALNRWASS